MRRTLAPALNTGKELGLGVGVRGEGGGGGLMDVYLFQVTTAMAMMTRRVTTVSEIARACGEIGCGKIGCGEIGCEFNGDMEGVGEMWLVLECG